MGQISNTKIIILAICFVSIGIVIHKERPSKAITRKVSLSQVLSDIRGWRGSGSLPLDINIIEELKLDDYVNQKYIGASGSVFLYIGYYITSKKVGASHDPLVCFSGQGWQLSNTKNGKLVINQNKSESISYSMMTAKRGQQKELVVYWFQSYNKTSSGTFYQKITTLWEKVVLGHGEDNAFVRITTPIGNRSISECKETIHKFIRVFYPAFLNYIEE